jgi:hypothetical protein
VLVAPVFEREQWISGCVVSGLIFPVRFLAGLLFLVSAAEFDDVAAGVGG